MLLLVGLRHEGTVGFDDRHSALPKTTIRPAHQIPRLVGGAETGELEIELGPSSISVGERARRQHRSGLDRMKR